jgi:hypothetical protein
MSVYFDFTVERKNNYGMWVCVAKSSYDELEILNPYILKHAFWDADFSESLSSLKENELTNETFYEFSVKSNKNKIGKPPIIVESTDDLCNKNKSVLDVLDSWQHSRKKNNDTCLWVNKDFLLNHKDFLSGILNFNSDSITEISDIEKRLKNSTSLDEINSFLNMTNNVLYDKNLIGFINHASVYSTIENIKYNPSFRELNIERVSLLEYEGLRQYELHGKVSYTKDIKNMISEIDKNIENVKNSKKAEEIAKSYISEVLSYYEDDKSENSTELYKKLSEYCEGSENYDDDYFNDLINEKNELQLLLRFMGDNGRLIWDIG